MRRPTRKGLRIRLVGMAIGAVLGAYLGSATGLVGYGSGVSGLWVFALLFGAIGFLAAGEIRNRFK